MDSIRITDKYVRKLLLQRSEDSHKGDYGHVLIVAGSKGFTGAAMLCALGALRSGAGLVTVGIPKSQQPIIASSLPYEAMTLELSETRESTVSSYALEEILSFIEKRKVTSLAVGPGLGISAEIKYFLNSLISEIDLPIVLDADGITNLSSDSAGLKNAKAKIVITPHPGELSRLINVSVESIQKNRKESAIDTALKNNVICVLKGHDTIVTDGKETFTNPTGNPGMATGGSGDVLSGMIAAFTGQVADPILFNAAILGVYVHGLAGDIAADIKTQIGMVAGDIAQYIPDALKTVISGK